MEIEKKLQKAQSGRQPASSGSPCPGVSESHPAGWCAHSLGSLQHCPRVGGPTALHNLRKERGKPEHHQCRVHNHQRGAGADDAGDHRPRPGPQLLTVIPQQPMQRARPSHKTRRSSRPPTGKCHFWAFSIRWVCSLDYLLLAGLKPVKS